MSKAAAFFDLDRTLIADSSGLLITEALVEAGLLRSIDKTAADLTRRAYRLVGETWIGMQATRRSIARIAGWTAADLRAAAEKSLDHMDRAVYAEARALIKRHHDDGHVVCIATSTGRDIVEPLADLLGADHLIATDYEVSDDGVLTGNLIGRWLWGPDKADAVKVFAEREDIDLSESYAYSDSYFDRHLLEMVGFPRPVNPDPVLRALAVRKGWPVLTFRGDAGLPKASIEPFDFLRPLGHPLLSPVNVHVEGLENIPERGACIIAANHRSYIDPVVLGTVAMRRGRKLRYLGKKEVLDAPVIGPLARALGQIRVDRGTGSAKPLAEAIDAARRGEAIGIFPQGTIPRGQEFFDPELSGKTGVARLALATEVPVIPVALWDTERIWPRKSRLPLPAQLLRRTAARARVGEPLMLEAPPGREEDRAVLADLTQRVMDAIANLLPDEVRYPPPPDERDVKAATPPNV